MDLLREEEIVYFRKDFLGREIRTKAYEVFNNIWVVPERYSVELIEDLMQVTNPEQFGVYNKNYLTSTDEQEEFLLTVKKAIETIQMMPNGISLLAAISAAVPLPSDKKASNTTLHCIKNGAHTYDVVANVVIWGSGSNLNSSKVISRDDNGSKDGQGSMCEILWNPNITIKNFSLETYKNPIDYLVMMLIQSLYRLYGLGLDQIFYPQIQGESPNEYFNTSVEQMLVQGGVTFQVSQLKPYFFLQNIYPKLLENYENAKQKIKKFEISSNYTELLNIKYSYTIEELLNIQAELFYSDEFAAEDESGDALVYYTGEESIWDISSETVPKGLFLQPQKHVVYTPNPELNYDVYEIIGNDVSRSFFEDYSFPEEKEIYGMNTEIQNVLFKVEVNRIISLVIDNITNFSEFIHDQQFETMIPVAKVASLQNKTTENIFISSPTFELLSKCTDRANSADTLYFTTKLADALENKNSILVFSDQLRDFLNNTKELTPHDLLELNKLLNFELLEENPSITYDISWESISWIDFVAVEVTGETLTSLIITGESQKIFTADNKMVLPHTRPNNTDLLKPYFFYQWYVKRYTQLLRFEGSLYRILDSHIKMINQIVQKRFTGEIPKSFISELRLTAKQAQISLHQLFEQVMYDDMQEAIEQVQMSFLKMNNSEATNDVLSHPQYNSVMNSRDIRSNNQVISKLSISKGLFDLPVLYLGRYPLKSSGVMLESEHIYKGIKSYKMSEGVGFTTKINTVYNDEVVTLKLLGRLSNDSRLNIAFDGEEFVIDNQVFYYKKDAKTIPIFNFDHDSWYSLELGVYGGRVFIKDIMTDRLLGSCLLDIGDNSVCKESWEFSFSVVRGDFILSSLELVQASHAYQKILDDKKIEAQGHYTGLIYTANNAPIFLGKSYQVNQMMLGDEYDLTIQNSKPVFRRTMPIIGSFSVYFIQDNLISAEYVTLDNDFLIKVDNGNDNYLRCAENGQYEYVKKINADAFTLKEVYVPENSSIAYLIMNKNGEVMNCQESDTTNEVYELTSTDVTQYLINQKTTLNLSIDFGSCMFQFKK